MSGVCNKATVADLHALYAAMFRIKRVPPSVFADTHVGKLALKKHDSIYFGKRNYKFEGLAMLVFSGLFNLDV